MCLHETTFPGFRRPRFSSPRRRNRFHKNILCLWKTAHRPWLASGLEQFGHCLYVPFHAVALDTWKHASGLGHIRLMVSKEIARQINWGIFGDFSIPLSISREIFLKCVFLVPVFFCSFWSFYFPPFFNLSTKI